VSALRTGAVLVLLQRSAHADEREVEREVEAVPPEPDAASAADAVPGDTSIPIPTVVRQNGRVGLRYVLEAIDVRGNAATGDRVVRRYLPFSVGDTLDVEDPELERARYRLLATGFFREVELSLRRGGQRGQVRLVVTVIERNTIVVNDVWLGLSSTARASGAVRPLTAFAGLDVSENNLGGSGVGLGGAVAVAERQGALRTRFVDPDFLRSSFLIEGLLLYNNAKESFGQRNVLVDDSIAGVAADYAVAAYQRFGGVFGVGHSLGPSTQLFVDYRIEKIDAVLPLAASLKRGDTVVPVDFGIIRDRSLLQTLRATFMYDTRNVPALPTRGSHVSLAFEFAPPLIGSDYGFAKWVFRGSRWFPMPFQHALRIEGFLGAILGEAPVFDRFYVGDFTDLLPDRVLELSVDSRPAPDFFGTRIRETRTGSYAAKLSAEYRMPVYRGTRAVYGVDVFGSIGVYGIASAPEARQARSTYSGIRNVPFDLTFNVGLRFDTALGALSFGTSTLIGFVPIRQGQP
jgi:outer membrane protein insertion porin family